MKALKQLVCLILVASMLAATPAFAAEDVTVATDEGSVRASNYFGRYSVFLYQTSAVTFEAWFDVSAVGMMDELGSTEIIIQRSSDGVTWETMRTITNADYPGMICANTSAHTYGISYTGTPTYYYRAYITLYAKKGNGFGEMYKYTSTLQL